ncbi:hypothetical protein AAG906_039891 [Vitis piasezkii]
MPRADGVGAQSALRRSSAPPSQQPPGFVSGIEPTTQTPKPVSQAAPRVDELKSHTSHMATGCSDGTLKLWRSNSFRSSSPHFLWELEGMFVAHQGPISAISLLDCGQKIATICMKFFEHGTEIPRKAPASELTGHVPPLSLQMPQLLYLRMNSGSLNLLRVVVLKLEATSKDLALAS